MKNIKFWVFISSIINIICLICIIILFIDVNLIKDKVENPDQIYIAPSDIYDHRGDKVQEDDRLYWMYADSVIDGNLIELSFPGRLNVSPQDSI